MAEAATSVDTGGFALLHTMIRVRDLERSIDFYTRHLGMPDDARALVEKALSG